MRIDIHSHLMSVAFAEHLQGRGTLPATVRDASRWLEWLDDSRRRQAVFSFPMRRSAR